MEIQETKNSRIESNCSQNNFISGSAFITFKDCTPCINGIQYDKELPRFNNKFEVSMAEMQRINILDNVEDLKLHKLNLKSIKDTNSIIQWKRITATISGAIYFLLCTGIIITTIIIIKKKKIIISTLPETTFVTTTPSFWPSLQSRWGGVTIQGRYVEPPTKPP